MGILEKLQAAGINFRLETFWDHGVAWELGDRIDGIKAKGTSPDITIAILDLAHAAKINFPLTYHE